MIIATMDLPSLLENCPVGWQNFIDSIDKELKGPDDDGFSTEALNAELTLYNAKFIKDTCMHSVIGFETEEGLMHFILRFGDVRS